MIQEQEKKAEKEYSFKPTLVTEKYFSRKQSPINPQESRIPNLDLLLKYKTKELNNTIAQLSQQYSFKPRINK